MKKNNYVVIALAAVLGAFLLFLWYYLGFNKIDNPLDLVLSILWWVADAAVVAGIVHFEKKRQEQIRTIYVSPAALFNSERGVVSVPDAAQRVGAMESILQSLSYDFSNEDMPGRDDFEYLYVVQTEKYKAADKDEAKDRAAEASVSAEAASGNEPADSAQAAQTSQAAGAEKAPEASEAADRRQPEWEGKVIRIDRENGNEETRFSSLDELAALLAA